MRLRRFRGTILVGVLVIAPFIVDGCIGAEPPGAVSEQAGDGTDLLGLEDSPPGVTGPALSSGPASGSGRSSFRGSHGAESGGSRMGGDSRLGGNSVHGFDTGGAGTSGSGLGDTGRPSIF